MLYYSIETLYYFSKAISLIEKVIDNNLIKTSNSTTVYYIEQYRFKNIMNILDAIFKLIEDFSNKMDIFKTDKSLEITMTNIKSMYMELKSKSKEYMN